MINIDAVLEDVIKSKLTKEIIERKVKEVIERIVIETGSLEVYNNFSKKTEIVQNEDPVKVLSKKLAKEYTKQLITKKPEKESRNLTITQIREIARELNHNLRKRLSDQRYRHKVGDYHLSPDKSFDLITELLLTENGYKLLQDWARASFNPQANSRVLVELIDPTKGVDKNNLRLCKRSKAKTFHHPILNKTKTDKTKWIKCQLQKATTAPIYYNPTRNDWVVTVRNGNRFFMKKHFPNKELAEAYAATFNTKDCL